MGLDYENMKAHHIVQLNTAKVGYTDRKTWLGKVFVGYMLDGRVVFIKRRGYYNIVNETFAPQSKA